MRARTVSVTYDQLTHGGAITVDLTRNTGNYVFKGFDQVELTPNELQHLIDEMSSMYLSNLPELWEGEEPTPKATAPDRPSNVGQLRPTVELPDLGDLKF